MIKWIRKQWILIRYGNPTSHITETAGHNVAAAIEYRDRSGRVIGFWEYGYWHPELPYKGEFND